MAISFFSQTSIRRRGMSYLAAGLSPGSWDSWPCTKTMNPIVKQSKVNTQQIFQHKQSYMSLSSLYRSVQSLNGLNWMLWQILWQVSIVLPFIFAVSLEK
jgi:hypothetical protein